MRTLKDILSNVESLKTSLCEGLLAGMEETIKIGDTYKEKIEVIDKYIDKFNTELNNARKSNKRKYKNPFGGHTYDIEASDLLKHFDVARASECNNPKYSYTGIQIDTYFYKSQGSYSLTIKLYDYYQPVRELWNENNLDMKDSKNDKLRLDTEEAMFDSLEKKVFKDAKTFVKFMKDNGINLKN